MAVPYRRTSGSKARKRRAHHALTASAHTHCTNCGEVVLPHHVCAACGFYKGMRVLDASADEAHDDEETEV